MNRHQLCASCDSRQFEESPKADEPVRSPGAPVGAPAKRSAEGASSASSPLRSRGRGEARVTPEHDEHELRRRAILVLRERFAIRSRSEWAAWTQGRRQHVLRAIDSLIADGSVELGPDGSFYEL
jgi:hypothetical protein